MNIEEHKSIKTGWRARWGKFKDRLVKILSICFLIMVPIVNIYIRFFYDGISENSIYELWQSENHKLAISYNEGGRSRKYDWEIVQDGKILIKNARTQKLKVLKMEPSTLKFTPRKVWSQTFPQRTATTI